MDRDRETQPQVGENSNIITGQDKGTLISYIKKKLKYRAL